VCRVLVKARSTLSTRLTTTKQASQSPPSPLYPVHGAGRLPRRLASARVYRCTIIPDSAVVDVERTFRLAYLFSTRVSRRKSTDLPGRKLPGLLALIE